MRDAYSVLTCDRLYTDIGICTLTPFFCKADMMHMVFVMENDTWVNSRMDDTEIPPHMWQSGEDARAHQVTS